MNCCDYTCTRASNCPAGSVDDWTKAIKDNSGIDWRTFDKPTATQPIDMFEPTGWIATMEWLQHTILPCLVSIVVGVVVTTIYFLTRG